MKPFYPVAFNAIVACVMLIASYAAAMGQTGPGGAENSTNNVFWIMANNGPSDTVDGAAITSWADQSGNGIDVAQANSNQRPLYRNNIMNGYPAVQFDFNNSSGQNDFLTAPDNILLDNTTGLTIYTVIRSTNLGSARSIISKRTNVSVNHSYMFFFFSSNYLFLDVQNTDNRFDSSPASFTTGTNYLLGFMYDGTLASSQRSKIYSAGQLIKTSTESASAIADNNSPLVIGATHTTDARAFGGYMSEIIIYRKALNRTERILVDNYLSAKYAINLSTKDLYTMDNLLNGDYDHDVAGIGQISATDLSDDGQGSGYVRILNPNDLNDGEFMIWGHDGTAMRADETTDIPADLQARITRVWRVSEVDTLLSAVDVGSVDLRFDLSQFASVTNTDLRLLIDTDNDGTFADETSISGATHLGAGIYEFGGVSLLTNGLRFTIGTINTSQTPLSIELIRFNAVVNEHNQAILNWETATESNSDFYQIKASADGHTWHEVGTSQGAGNKNTLTQYQFVDPDPIQTHRYYEVMQYDFDGTASLVGRKYLRIKNDEMGRLFPNPTDGKLQFQQNNIDYESVKILSANGTEVPTKWIKKEPDFFELDVTQLAAGQYFMMVNSKSYVFTKQ
jgi:hypothetical protein